MSKKSLTAKRRANRKPLKHIKVQKVKEKKPDLSEVNYFENLGL